MLIINLNVIDIVINTMFTHPWKNDKKSHGWQFTAEVNYPLSRQFSQTEAHTHQSLSWDLKSVVHSLDVYGLPQATAGIPAKTRQWTNNF